MTLVKVAPRCRNHNSVIILDRASAQPSTCLPIITTNRDVQFECAWAAACCLRFYVMSYRVSAIWVRNNQRTK